MIFLDEFPVWGVFVGMVVVVLIAAEIGFRIGIWIQDRNPVPGETRITGTVVAGMLSLLAFLMAFSIGVVLNQHGDRRAMVVEEANAIGTAWLRAGFLTEPDRSSSRALLQEYTEIRLQAATDSTRMAAAVARSEEIQNELWAVMVIFALVFVAVLIIVVDLDRPQEGMLTVRQTAMSDLLRQMTTPGH